MAWITEEPNGYMVRWRDADTGKTRSHMFKHPPPGGVAEAEGITTLARAESFALDETTKERRSQTAIDRLPFKRPPILSSDQFVEADFAVADYLRKIIRQDAELTESSRQTYFHNIKNHIAGTRLGVADIRGVTVGVVHHRRPDRRRATR